MGNERIGWSLWEASVDLDLEAQKFLGKEKRRKWDWARELPDHEADLTEVKCLKIQKGEREGRRVDLSLEESLTEWKKPAFVHCFAWSLARGQCKKNVTDLGLKVEVDSGEAHSWRLAVNHAPHRQAVSFLEGQEQHISVCVATSEKNKLCIYVTL